MAGSSTDPMQLPVANPALSWLHSLLAEVQTAQASIPDLDGPTSSIGPGPAWMGTKADDVHAHDLAPLARPFKQALAALDDDVRAAINSTPATVTAGTAKLMRIDHDSR